jgi:REP element-mobilizing transposase RayT
MGVREKSHRLFRDLYKGEVSAIFTLCIKDRVTLFTKPDVVSAFIDILKEITLKGNYIIPVYCFMPNHQHLIVRGTKVSCDVRQAIVHYKQKTGFWMITNKINAKWQKDFYDHIIRKHEELPTQVRYILDNPVRKGLVPYWQDYPFKGSIGCKLNDILNGIT